MASETQNRLADILHLLRAEKLEEGGRDGVLAEITALATVLRRESARAARARTEGALSRDARA